MNTTQTTSFTPNEIAYATKQLRRAIDSFRSGKIGEPRARMRVAELRAKYGSLLPQPTPKPESTGEYTERVWGISLCDDCGQPQSECACPQLPDGLSESECPLPDPDQGPANDPPTCPGCGNELAEGTCDFCPGICPACGAYDCDCPDNTHNPGPDRCQCCGESTIFGDCGCPPHPDDRPTVREFPPEHTAEVITIPARELVGAYCPYCNFNRPLKHRAKTCGDPTCRKRAQYCTANPQS